MTAVMAHVHEPIQSQAARYAAAEPAAAWLSWWLAVATVAGARSTAAARRQRGPPAISMTAFITSA